MQDSLGLPVTIQLCQVVIKALGRRGDGNACVNRPTPITDQPTWNKLVNQGIQERRPDQRESVGPKARYNGHQQDGNAPFLGEDLFPVQIFTVAFGA